MSVGTPQLQYHVPYYSQPLQDGQDDIHSHWHVILTTTGKHFYFNSKLKTSHWQLHDIKTVYGFETVEWDEFVNCIEYDEVAVLAAKIRGLKGLGLQNQNQQHIVDEKQEEAVPEKITEHSDNEASAGENSDDKHDSDSEVDEEARDEYISNLLKEEGFIKSPEPETEQSDGEKQHPAGGLVGYSSSEEEEEEEEDEEENEELEASALEKDGKQINTGDVSAQDSEQRHVEEGSDSEDEVNADLDLSLSDGEDAISGTSLRDEFVRLLESLGGKISIYDSWPMIEEELISELVQHAEFYSVKSIQEREEIFNGWVQQQLGEVKADSPSPIQEPEPQKYPSPPIEYFRILQDFKSDIKKMYYQEFFNQHQERLQELELTKREKENLYREFKVMITDFSQYERKIKKSKSYDPNQNLKKAELLKFLKQRRSTIQSVLAANSAAEGMQVNDHFAKWILFLNANEFPADIAENCTNFIVGDEKRLQCYEEVFCDDK
ncbi:uncharacterized protein CANTADRAFT_92243 [Suhomyces tanzawaensis NRRL Y-17324]|uniref:WW domain-containing protein n=1 Tax=Suhomyces tanzawaensis NRRL Y-17324 TaxID=984487 RepID=A0A1E4SC42_9ASCO|nr:uncharacterized protein CANTADRAFT_92243 [Suhomyces tanzawaensis NRRL Y-17324]ODV77065.1 hypothetical protein CANTADRAFT_92243 [Suhomyces tanzawaensis NRRL Y-17324]